jgi:flavin reductase (DIM6/NTAB) family NADH-FMN oxidoreductase RutF
MTKVTKKASTILYPVPAVMVSCGTGEQVNIITLAWVGTLCSQPPLVGISVRPNRYSHGLIQEAGEFVVNLPTAELARWVDYCGTVSGRDEDKWAACGFSQAPATEVQTPLIAECPVNIECRLQQTLSLGTHDLFIGEVLAVQMDQAVLNERGVFDPAKAQPFAYVAGEYWQFSKFLGRHGFSKQK